MTDATLYALLAFGLAGLGSTLVGLALLHAAWWERHR